VKYHFTSLDISIGIAGANGATIPNNFLIIVRRIVKANGWNELFDKPGSGFQDYFKIVFAINYFNPVLTDLKFIDAEFVYNQQLKSENLALYYPVHFAGDINRYVGSV